MRLYLSLYLILAVATWSNILRAQDDPKWLAELNKDKDKIKASGIRTKVLVYSETGFISNELKEKNRDTFVYNPRGLLTEKSGSYDAHDKSHYRYRYIYDGSGRLIKQTCITSYYDKKQRETETKNYRYNDQGMLVEVEYFFTSYMNGLKAFRTDSFETDKAGNVVRETITDYADGNRSSVNTYDDHNNINQSNRYRKVGRGNELAFVEKYINSYDVKNRLTECVQLKTDNAKRETSTFITRYTYDELNRIVTKLDSPTAMGGATDTRYEYDGKGNITKEQVRNKYKDVITYEYDENGNLGKKQVTNYYGSVINLWEYVFLKK